MEVRCAIRVLNSSCQACPAALLSPNSLIVVNVTESGSGIALFKGTLQTNLWWLLSYEI